MVTNIKNMSKQNVSNRIKNLLYTIIVSIFLFSCEKGNQIPDPDPDPDPTPTNQTILDSICALTFVFDSEGTAWIGTLSQGLVKYSLTETVIFNSSNSQLTNDPIWDITVDSKDNIWIGTYGLVKYDGVEFTSYNTSNSDIPEDIVWSVAVDSSDNIWMASSRFNMGGLTKFDGEIFTVFTPENSALPVNSIHAIAIDNDDNVWVAATQAVNSFYLIKISGGLWTVYDSVDFKQKISWVDDIEINSKNQVCGAIGSYTSPGTPKGVLCFDGSNMEIYNMEESIRGGFESILVDSSDNFWCTFGYGYTYYDGIKWNKTEAEVIGGYYQEGYFTIEQAPDGNIWIGKGNGIEIIERNK
jgi:ligand-binding sensor domain-containing protein